MTTPVYVSLSGQLALEKQLTAIAQNVANMNTAGYRGQEMSFEEIVSKAGAHMTSFAGEGKPRLSLSMGAVKQTDSLLDMAIEGDGWFAFQRGDTIGYTRDGRMQVDENGNLLTVNGDTYLDSDGGPLTVDPDSGPIRVQRDGEIFQDGQIVGAIGLYRFDSSANLSRLEGSAVTSELPPIPLSDFSDTGILQGYVEMSNINPIEELSRLIKIQRSFDRAALMVDNSFNRQNNLIRELGRPI